MTKKHLLRLTALLVAAVLCLGCAPAALAAFPDVEQGKWYTGYIETLTGLGMLKGYTDGTFKPNAELSRGEFAKLINSCLGGEAQREGDRHWAAGHVDDLIEAGVLYHGEMDDSKENLDLPITRYEMAVMLVRASDLRGDVSFIDFDGSTVISDWGTIPSYYAYYVMQAFSRGLLGGYPDGSFGGLNSLTRAEACAVIVRLLFPYERLSPDIEGFEDVPLWLGQISYIEVPEGGYMPPVDESEPPVQGGESEPVPPQPSEPVVPPADLFAPVQSAVGFMSGEEQRLLLFGDASRTTFASKEDADACMVDVTLRVWRKGSDGVKRETQVTIPMHRALASDVQGIFEMIFNGPEQYCIQSIGGYSWTSMLRSEHNAGSAIDINPFANPYVNSSGQILVGDYYEPGDEYSLTAESDVVKAFAAYGWGWGGEGNWSSGALDYMHFSLRGT